MSSRKYWSVDLLLKDWAYWRDAQPKYNRAKAHASWSMLCAKWGVPKERQLDEWVQAVIESRDKEKLEW